MNKVYWLSSGKFLITVVGLSYIAYLIFGLFFDYLGANPVEVITHETGSLGLYFLLASLTVTPLRRHFHLGFLIKVRRFLGLWSFTFIFLHLFVFLFFDHFFDINTIIDDIVERAYIAVGFTAFLLMVPLAVSSFKLVQKKMGKHWVTLHRIVYIVAILGIIHYWWLVKADVLKPLLFFLVLVFLLSDRVYWHYQKKM